MSNFLSLIQIVFGSNIAYAALIRTGQLQGNHLRTFADEHLSQATAAQSLYTAEDEAFKLIKLDGDKARIDNIVSEAKGKMERTVPWFASLSLLMAIGCLIMLFACAAWSDTQVSNFNVLLVTVVFLVPIPCGLGWTYKVVRSYEQKIVVELNKFFDSCDHLGISVKADVDTTVSKIRNSLNLPRPSVMRRLFRQGRG